MKNNHLQTAVKALKKQVDKYKTDRDRFEVAERSAKDSKEFFAKEVERLEKQIKQLEGTETQKELSLT